MINLSTNISTDMRCIRSQSHSFQHYIFSGQAIAKVSTCSETFAPPLSIDIGPVISRFRRAVLTSSISVPGPET